MPLSKQQTRNDSVNATRRQVLLGTVAALSTAMIRPWSSALGAPVAGSVNLTAGPRSLQVNGKPASVYGLTVKDSSTGLRFVKGQQFGVTLENALSEPTLVHWHGLMPPSEQDGVPDLSQPPLSPGKTYDYNFTLKRSGTYWAHSYVGVQAQKLLTAPLIVSDPEDAQQDEQEIIIQLQDFTFRDPSEILAEFLKRYRSHAHGKEAPAETARPPGTVGKSIGRDFHFDIDQAIKNLEPAKGAAVNDVSFDAYLANDRTLDDPEIVRVTSGGKLRLRIINAASATNFWIDLGALEGELIAVDGDKVQPVRAKRFELGIAQRLDIRMALPKGEKAYPILALREGTAERTGIVLATQKASIGKIAHVSSAAHPELAWGLEQKLRAVEPLAERPADESFRVDVVGNRARYRWGLYGWGRPAGKNISGRKGASPLAVRRGQRVEITLRNPSPLPQSIHLHGHRFQVVAIGDDKISGAMRDTILIPAGQDVKIAFDADNPGKWAFDGQHIYRRLAGMTTSLEYVT